MAKKRKLDDPTTPQDESLEVDVEGEETIDPSIHIIVDGAVVESPLEGGKPGIRERRHFIGGRNVEHTHEERGVWAYRSM